MKLPVLLIPKHSYVQLSQQLELFGILLEVTLKLGIDQLGYQLILLQYIMQQQVQQVVIINVILELDITGIEQFVRVVLLDIPIFQPEIAVKPLQLVQLEPTIQLLINVRVPVRILMLQV